MTDAELRAAADLSLAEVLREEARHAPGGALREERGVLWCSGPGRFPLSPNTVMRVGPARPEGPGPAEILDRADALHGERQAGYSVHLRLGDADDDLADEARRRRPVYDGDAPAMVVEARLRPGRPIAADVAVAPVADADDAAAYAAVVDDAYQSSGWPAGGPAELFSSPSLLLAPGKAGFVARLAGCPAAAAYVSVTHGLGLVSWVGTVGTARGRGLAAAVTVAATNAGFDLGAAGVWLVSSPMGEPTYRRLGFREFARSRTIVLWPSLALPGEDRREGAAPLRTGTGPE